MNNSVVIFLILLKDEFQLMRRISINEMDRVRQRMVEEKTKKMKKQKRRGRRRKGQEGREKEKGQLSRK